MWSGPCVHEEARARAHDFMERRSKNMRMVAGVIAFLASLGLLMLGATPAYADPSGNNGTVKIINDQGDGQDDPDNDPHVCRFHISGSNFDKNSSGTWHVEVWSPGGGALAAAQTAGTWSANALGKFDAFPAQPFPSGHYKLGVKQNTPSSPGGEKQKVFWVRCGTTAEVASTTVAARENEEHAATSKANAVAGVETVASAVAGVESVPATPPTTSGTVAGIQSLPSTSTSETAPLLMSGALIAAVGGLLLWRAPRPGR